MTGFLCRVNVDFSHEEDYTDYRQLEVLIEFPFVPCVGDDFELVDMTIEPDANTLVGFTMEEGSEYFADRAWVVFRRQILYNMKDDFEPEINLYVKEK